MAARVWEIAGFITIAAALHVSAAALMMPQSSPAGAISADVGPPAALSAGSEALADLVAEWEAPPEIAMAAPIAAPVEPEQPVLVEPSTDLAMPEPVPTPEPPVTPVAPVLPDLESFTPPEFEAAEPALALAASDRPQRRPEAKPEPQPRAQSRAEAPKKTAQPAARSQPAGQGGAAGQQQARRSSGGGGGGGASPQQQANAEARWKGQLAACLSRSIGRPSGARGARMAVAVTIARNGRIQAVSVAASSGNPRVDQEVMRGAKRARCPAAPSILSRAQYSIVQPISIN